MRRTLLLPVCLTLVASSAFADDEPPRELRLQPLPPDKVEAPEGTRRFAAEKPFVYTEDPTTASKGSPVLGYGMGLASGTAAERPLPASIGAPGVMHALTLSYGATSRLEPFVLGRVLQATKEGQETRAGGGAGLKAQLTKPGATGFRLAVVGGAGREVQGTWIGYGRVLASYDVGDLRIAANGHFERAFSGQRDTIDVLVFAGASYRVMKELRAGFEYVGQDLEDAVEQEEAEGGARHYLGPTMALELDKGRVQLVAGPAFGLNQQAKGLLGRAALVVQF